LLWVRLEIEHDDLNACFPMTPAVDRSQIEVAHFRHVHQRHDFLITKSAHKSFDPVKPALR
jgi:hypothetical protein